MQRLQKKVPATYTAAHAALGGRTLKTGQSRWFVGYKKHTLRLWLPTRHPSVTLVPLVSWITPANVAEGGLLRPSLHWCRQRLGLVARARGGGHGLPGISTSNQCDHRPAASFGSD